MSRDERVIGEEGLLFFGKMTGSISHELKNSLAIINESAGLLEDFTAMAARGVPLDPERLNMVASKLRRQVRRSDGIIMRLNRFAHATDKPLDRINLTELLDSVCQLAERLATMRGVTLEVVTPPEPVTLETSAFRLQNVIWLCIEFLLRRTELKGVFRLIPEPAATGVRVRISPEAPLPGDANLDDMLPPDRRHALLDGMGAALDIDKESRSLVLALTVAPTP